MALRHALPTGHLVPVDLLREQVHAELLEMFEKERRVRLAPDLDDGIRARPMVPFGCAQDRWWRWPRPDFP